MTADQGIVAAPTNRFALLQNARQAMVSFCQRHSQGITTGLTATVPPAAAFAAFTPWVWLPVTFASLVAARAHWKEIGSLRFNRAYHEGRGDTKALMNVGSESRVLPLRTAPIFAALAGFGLVVSAGIHYGVNNPATPVLREKVADGCWSVGATFTDDRTPGRTRVATIAKVKTVENADITAAGRTITNASYEAQVKIQGPGTSFFFGRPITVQHTYTADARSGVYSPTYSPPVQLDGQRYSRHCTTGVLTPIR